MPEDLFVCHRAEHDPRNDNGVSVGVRAIPQSTRFVSTSYRFCPCTLSVVEIEPPQCHRVDECKQYRCDTHDGRCLGNEREARNEKRFTKRDDDEQGAAFGDVWTGDVPVFDPCRTASGKPESHRSRQVFDPECDKPEPDPEFDRHESAENPKDPRRGKPNEHTDENVGQVAVVAVSISLQISWKISWSKRF